MKPVDHYNMLAEAHDIGYQPEDALFVQYLNLILDQEDKMLEDESLSLIHILTLPTTAIV